MKIETLWELLQDEKYACLTVAEFVEIIKDSKVMEEDLKIYDPLDEKIPIIPDYMNAAIAEGVKNERKKNANK